MTFIKRILWKNLIKPNDSHTCNNTLAPFGSVYELQASCERSNYHNLSYCISYITSLSVKSDRQRRRLKRSEQDTLVRSYSWIVAAFLCRKLTPKIWLLQTCTLCTMSHSYAKVSTTFVQLQQSIRAYSIICTKINDTALNKVGNDFEIKRQLHRWNASTQIRLSQASVLEREQSSTAKV